MVDGVGWTGGGRAQRGARTTAGKRVGCGVVRYRGAEALKDDHISLRTNTQCFQRLVGWLQGAGYIQVGASVAGGERLRPRLQQCRQAAAASSSAAAARLLQLRRLLLPARQAACELPGGAGGAAGRSAAAAPGGPPRVWGPPAAAVPAW